MFDGLVVLGIGVAGIFSVDQKIGCKRVQNRKNLPSMGANPSAWVEALRDSTGQGGGLPLIAEKETSAFLRSSRLTAEERLFLPAR